MTLPNFRNLDKFTLAIIGTVVAIAVIILYLGSVLLKGKISLPKISISALTGQPRVAADVLFLTTPVNSLTGTVDRVSGDTIWVSKEVILAQPLTPATAPVGKTLLDLIKST